VIQASTGNAFQFFKPVNKIQVLQCKIVVHFGIRIVPARFKTLLVLFEMELLDMAKVWLYFEDPTTKASQNTNRK